MSVVVTMRTTYIADSSYDNEASTEPVNCTLK